MFVRSVGKGTRGDVVVGDADDAVNKRSEIEKIGVTTTTHAQLQQSYNFTRGKRRGKR